MKPSTCSSSFDLFSSSMGTRPAALSFATGVTGSGGVRTKPSSFTSVALVAIYGLHPGNDLQCGGKRSRIQAQCCIVCLTQLSAQQKYRSEEHTSELQSLMRISYAVFCLKKKKKQNRDK